MVKLNVLSQVDVFVICHYLTLSLRLSLSPSPAFWSFMWFVGFCFLANQWQVTKHEDNPLREGGDAARAAITFSFFSIFTWVRASTPQCTTLIPETAGTLYFHMNCSSPCTSNLPVKDWAFWGCPYHTQPLYYHLSPRCFWAFPSK